jgi:iron complex outermembrane receptor protein
MVFDLAQPAGLVSFTGEAGSLGRRFVQGTVGTGRTSLSASHLTRDGLPLPRGADLPFSQKSVRERTNSDLRRTSTAGIFALEGRGWETSGIALLSTSRYGVPPEGHLDPERARVRFWRVPQDDRLTAGLRARRAGEGLTYEGSAWHQAQRRSIDAFGSSAYLLDQQTERLRSASSGLRLSVGGLAGPLYLRGGGEVREEETRVRVMGEEHFTRRTDALWLRTWWKEGFWSGGASFRAERFQTLRSGQRDRAPDQHLLTGRGTISYQPGEHWRLEFSGARLGRFPSQRELYGEALGRFEVNPDLKPERRDLVQATVARSGETFQLSLTPFAEWSELTIGQRALADQPGTRVRINEGGFRTVGAEGGAS